MRMRILEARLIPSPTTSGTYNAGAWVDAGCDYDNVTPLLATPDMPPGSARCPKGEIPVVHGLRGEDDVWRWPKSVPELAASTPWHYTAFRLVE